MMFRTPAPRPSLPLFSLLAAAFAIGCVEPVSIGGTTGGAGSTSTSTASGGSDTGGGGATGGGATTSSGGAGGYVFHEINCHMACQTSADCDGHVEDENADNHDCIDGVCVWKGCNNDEECSFTYGPEYICRHTTHSGLPSCVKSCSQPEDCSWGIPAHDADNFACEAGACDDLGCHSDAECTNTYGDAWACVQFQGVPGGQCWLSCHTSADCDFGSPPMSPDNFTCDDGLCTYSTCHDDAECQAVWEYTVCIGN